ncbi:MAG: 50S ribosomal protein L35 [Candidatus Saganbacteria bacterium]|nr:50S ribosomal protein L35 [Candidatus Saganbacteria bacterium]
MPKQKTRKAAAKRFKVTKSGKILRWKTKRRHLLECKSSKKMRAFRRPVEISPTDRRRVKSCLPGI